MANSHTHLVTQLTGNVETLDRQEEEEGEKVCEREKWGRGEMYKDGDNNVLLILLCTF